MSISFEAMPIGELEEILVESAKKVGLGAKVEREIETSYEITDKGLKEHEIFIGSNVTLSRFGIPRIQLLVHRLNNEKVRTISLWPYPVLGIGSGNKIKEFSEAFVAKIFDYERSRE